MQAIQILFVEDDESQLQLLQDAANEWNNTHDQQRIEVAHAATVESAKDKLRQLRLDAALFDLRLPAAEGEKGAAKGGNDLAELSLKEVGIPVGIISGNPADLEPDLVALNLLKSFNKGDEDVYSQVIAWLESKWIMMSVLGSTRRQIQASGADIFLKRLWPRWETYAGLKGTDQDELTRIVTRQYVGHVAELLGIDGEDNAPWHPYECYIHPALLEGRAHTGDIFNLDDQLFVVMTPACDMATQKAETVLLVAIDQDSQPDWNANVTLLGQPVSNNQRDKRDKFFLRLVNQNVDVSEHFLPPLNGSPPLMVRFKKVSTKPLDWLNANLNLRQASIAPPFLPNLVQRFGSWISRTGQPNIAISHLG